MTRLSTIGQIAMPVKDLSHAVAFYRDVLGMKFLFQAPPALAFFDCGGVRLMLDAAAEGKSIAAYGAPAKAATLLNYAGVRADYIDYTVDRNPHKQNHFLPGTQIPIYGPERIAETRPDYLVILAWNLKDEVMKQMAHIREWGGRFVVLIPEVRIHD